MIAKRPVGLIQSQKPVLSGVSSVALSSVRELGGSAVSERPEAVSRLDTEHITRPEAPDRRSWLLKVEKVTESHRVEKAKKHWRRAGELKAERLLAGLPYEEAVQGARWHQRRAYGQIERFSVVLDCGVESLWLVCEACGRCKEKASRCRAALLCVSCRAVIGREKRSRFKPARERALSRADTFGMFRPLRRGGRWSEKLLTLTIPHLPEHGPRTRIELLFRALPLFRKALKKWLHPKDHSYLVAWFRTFEWTPATDGQGHPHFHWWLLCPYLERPVVCAAWAQGLRTAGFSRATAENVVVDVREVQDDEGAAHEVIKYLTKDILPNRQFVDPEVFGEVYAALDGRRTTQPSRGFFTGIDQRAVCECGASGAFKHTTTRPEPKSGSET